MALLWTTRCQVGASSARLSIPWRGKAARSLKTYLGLRFPLNTLLRQRFRATVADGRPLLFVCKGNICRSPFAERYARNVFPASRQIESCGYYPQAGRRSPAVAISAAAEFGVDLRSHRSQLIQRHLVEEASVIFTFDEENRRAVVSAFPEVRHKTFALGTYTPGRNMMIEDPYGGSPQTFLDVYSEIRAALDHCARDIAAR